MTPPPQPLGQLRGTRRSGLSPTPPPPARVGIAGSRPARAGVLGASQSHRSGALPPPAGRGKCSPGSAESPYPPPPQLDPWKERVRERRFGKVPGPTGLGDAGRPPPTPAPAPGRAARSLLPRAGSWGQVGAPGPGRAGSGVGGSCQCGGRGRGASGPRGRLLITRPPSPGSLSHGKPGAPARRGRRRPGREVGPCRARVAVPWGGGAG